MAITFAVTFADTTPTAFSFTDVTGAALSTSYESNAITVLGINAPATMTITGGEYQKNGGSWASTSTTVVVNDTVKVRTTSSGSNSTAVNAVLSIGGVSDTYTVTTVAASGGDYSDPSGFNALKISGGGYMVGIFPHPGNNAAVGGSGSVAADGSVVTRSDVAGAYHRDAASTDWRQLISVASIAGLQVASGDEAGCLDIAIAPSDSNYIYMIYSDLTDTSTGNIYRVYKSTDRGVTFTTTSLAIGRSAYAPAGGMANSNYFKFGTGKILIDPYNKNVVVVGQVPIPFTGDAAGVYITTNGGTSWALTSIPGPTCPPGVAGMVADVSSGTTTGLNGVTCCARAIIPSGGQGVYLTIDGYQTFTKIADTKVSGTGTITVSNANSVILVQVCCPSVGSVNSVSGTNPSASPISFTYRGSYYDTSLQMNFFEYFYATSTTGDYVVSVNYADGLPCGFGSNKASAACVVISGANIAGGATTIFDNSAMTATSSQGVTVINASYTTTAANSMMVVYSFSSLTATPASGYAVSNTDPDDFVFQQYGIEASAGAKTINIPDGYGYIADAIKKGGGGALQVDDTLLIQTVAVSETQPANIICGQIDADGNYWAATAWQFSSVDGHVFRLLSGGSWEIMDATGGGAGCRNGPGTIQGTSIIVNPMQARVGEVVVLTGAQNNQASQTFNGTAARASVSWNLRQDGAAPITYNSADAEWQTHLAGNGAAFAEFRFDPYSGTYWSADGVKCATTPGDALWGPYPGIYWTFSQDIKISGVEIMVGHDVIAGPRANSIHPVAVCEDRSAFYTNMPGCPTDYSVPFSGNSQSNGCQGDWATDDPSWVMHIAMAGITDSPMTCYSTNYGQTWTECVHQPLANGLDSPTSPNNRNGRLGHGGTGCTAGVGTIIVCGKLFTPMVTHDAGATAWAACSGLPTDATYVFGGTGIQSRSRGFANNRTNKDIVYCYAYGGAAPGFYVSTNAGTSFTKKGSFLLGTTENGVNVVNPMGYVDDVFITALYGSSGTSQYIYYSANANATTPTFTAIGASTFDDIHLFGIGKLEAGGTYPTMFVFADHTVSGRGFWKSKDKGATWTGLGLYPGILPANNQFEYPQQLVGDWARGGVFYLPMNGTGVVQYAP